ncbi:MAG: hypothetical protein A2Y12_05100 [Planctomycetes bacterium GWF2_42_9]|nr:MAG: hypothetical protein A2Y12_05100 [Planctomycetes bacterium GWF2_42_9]HAL44701.1 hypothetical protein [Phycisphaerales bacterium]
MKKLSVLVIALLALSSVASAVVLYTPAAGDVSFSWNSKYSSYDSYEIGKNTMGIYLSFGGTWGNDRTVAIFEIPIASLAGKTVSSAMLEVDAFGFGTNYYYGSAAIGWLDTGTKVLTGDVVADAISRVAPSGFTIYNSDYGFTDGVKSFDVLSYVQADLAAGRAYSTFVLSGSRETYGSLYTAESGSGPRIVAVIPEPSTIAILGFGIIAFIKKTK